MADPVEPIPVEQKFSPFAGLAFHKRQLALGIVCLFVTNALAQAVPWVVKLAIDAVKAGGVHRPITRLVLWIGVLATGQALIRIVSRVLIFNVGRQVEYRLRNQLFAKLLSLAPSFYRVHPTGDLMSRLTNDLSSVRAMFGPGILYVANSIFAYGMALPLMIRIDPWLTLLALAPYPLLFLNGRWVAGRIHALSFSVQQELGAMSATLQEDLAGATVVKAYGLEERRGQAFAARCQAYLERSLALGKLRASMMPLMGLTAGVGTLLALFVGAWMVTQGRITLGDLIAFNMYLGMLAWPTLAVGWILSMWQRGLAAWERLVELLREQATIVDPPAPPVSAAAPVPAPPESPPDSAVLRGDIEVRQLNVALGGKPILDDVSMRVPEGSVLGVVGRVGSGKSTLCEALPRLVEIPPGTVFIGGTDVTTVPLATLRRSIGYAPQDAFLFSMSMRENIAFGATSNGNGNSDASGGHDLSELDQYHHDRAAEAARAAGLAPDLEMLPQGLETVVGERGITLSGGQRQRTALARALAPQPPILILDDSLSSVDAATERDVLTQLRSEMHGRTAIVVSHRVTALEGADHIIVLDRGRIVEQGRHEDLLARGGHYSDLYSQQIAAEELAAL